MDCFSEGYARFGQRVLALLLILAASVERAAAADWEAKLEAASPASLDGWAVGFAVQTAQAEARFSFDIPAETLPVALTRFQQITGLTVAADSTEIAAARTMGVRGTLTAGEALAALLAGTGLSYRIADATTVAVEPAADGGKNGPVVLNPLPVT